MINRHARTQKAATMPLLVAAVLIAVGCAGKSTPARYYMLSSIEAPAADRGEGSDGVKPIVGIGPIEFPDYLDRPQIVLRTADNAVQIRPFDRWAEPLSDNFNRVLVQNLSVLLETDSVYPYPWSKNLAANYQVGIHVYAFDIVDRQYARLEAAWAVFPTDGNGLILKKHSHHRRRIESAGIEAYISALNGTLDAFSREMAEELRFLVSRRPLLRSPDASSNTPGDSGH